ncbi:MAG TPA: MFS transporter, partial [Candidatus Nanopelagicales bacterium]|nr:MFS transporter [Candidatus Nanopelagicales bacterium]
PLSQAKGPMRATMLLGISLTGATLGNNLTAFALGVWLFQRTGSTTLYAAAGLAGLLPMLLASPLAGALVDRWGPRRAIALAHGAGFAISLLLAAFSAMGALSPPGMLLLIALCAAFQSMHLPALSAAMTMLVPTAQLGRANGLLQLGNAAASVAAPAGAGVLLGAGGLTMVLGLVALCFAAAVAAFVGAGAPRRTAAGGGGERKRALLDDCIAGFRYLRARPGLGGFLLVLFVVNFNFFTLQVLVTPLVLSFADARTLGTVLSLGGVGMIFGSAVLLSWGGPRRAVHGVLAFTLLQGLLLFLGAARPSALLVTAGAFGFLFVQPIIAGLSQTFWHRKIPPHLQGSVGAARILLSQSAGPVAMVLAGPLADHVFQPLMAEGGALSDSLGKVMGVGPGRGAALHFFALGALAIAAAGAALSSRVRGLDDAIPDHDAAPPGAHRLTACSAAPRDLSASPATTSNRLRSSATEK